VTPNPPQNQLFLDLKSSSSCTHCKKYLTPVPPDSDLSNVLGEPAPALLPLKDEGHEHLPDLKVGGEVGTPTTLYVHILVIVGSVAKPIF
jgi:hypothetical protein